MITPQALTAPQREKLQDLTSSQLDDLRLQAKTNLYFLSKGILGYNQVEEKAHAALCAFMANEINPLRAVLVFRGFLKSTICTIADSIRLALCDPDNTRILIVNEVFENAAGFLDELKAHWTNDGMLPFLFPELVPKKLMGPGSDWSMANSSINRSSVYKESTWSAFGVGGAAQSKHFSHIKCDDLIGEAAKESPAVMERTIRWTDSLMGLLDRLDGPIDYYGTRKTISDLYGYLIRLYGPRMKVFLREPLENGETIFSKMKTESLLSIMIDKPEVWAHDYMNNPIGKGGIDWGDGYLRYYEILSSGRIRLEDTLTGKLKMWERGELDVVITVDPNSGKPLAPDKSAIVVHGVTPDEEIIILDAWSGRPSPEGLIDEVWQRCIQYNPRVVGIEEAGQQNTLFYFEKRCTQRGQYYHVVPLKHGNKDKERRIRTALDTPLKSRRVYVTRTQFTLINAVQFFPQLQVHMWDELDALSYGPELYQVGMRTEDLEAAEEAQAKVLELRGITGYGDSCIPSQGLLVR